MFGLGKSPIDEQDIRDLKSWLEAIRDGVCGPLCLDTLSLLIRNALDWLQEENPHFRTYLVARRTITDIQDVVVADLARVKFFAVAPDRSNYYGNLALFGPAVKAFPSAQDDIKEALLCLATEANTAAVFHLMRVAEFGLRVLARDRRASVPKGPLELATWEEVVKALEESEKKIHGYPKTLVREQQYDFYHGALMEIRRFKNVWRNDIMHARDSYDRNDAIRVFNHVCAFMNILGSRISEESEPLPEVWGDKQLREDTTL